MSIDKRGTIGKIIDTQKVVWECLRCGKKTIGNKEKPTKCTCSNDKEEFVINGSLYVVKNA